MGVTPSPFRPIKHSGPGITSSMPAKLDRYLCCTCRATQSWLSVPDLHHPLLKWNFRVPYPQSPVTCATIAKVCFTYEDVVSIQPQSIVTCAIYSTKQFTAVQCYLRHIFNKVFLRSPVLPALHIQQSISPQSSVTCVIYLTKHLSAVQVLPASYVQQSISPQSKCYLRYIINKAILRSPMLPAYTCVTA